MRSNDFSRAWQHRLGHRKIVASPAKVRCVQSASSRSASEGRREAGSSSSENGRSWERTCFRSRFSPAPHAVASSCAYHRGATDNRIADVGPTAQREEHKDICNIASQAPSMFRGIRISTEFAFLLSGVFIMVVAWALNLIGVVSGDQSSGHGTGDIYLWLFLMFQGLAFSTVGVIGAHYREFATNPNLGKPYAVGFLLIADGGLHLLALNQHLGILPAALFFEVVAPLQILGGVAFPYLHRRWDAGWLLFTLFLIGAFVVTRTVALWPIGVIEEVDLLGILSKAVEVAICVLLISAMRANAAERDAPAPSAMNGP